jgi:hypothetical protein
VPFNQINKQTTEPQHLVHDFLRLGYCVTLAGKRECGKSDLATAIALAVAEGSPFAGSITTQGSVLWVAGDNQYDHRKSLRPISPRLNIAPFYVTYARPAIDTEEGIHDIAEWVVKTKARLIVVDPLEAAHSGGIGWDARATLAPFKKLCYRMGVTGLLLHTTRTTVNPLAEMAHLAAATDMSILYKADQTEAGRLVTLHARGRGEDSNVTHHLLSHAQFDYRLAGTSKRPIQKSAKFSLDDEIFACISNSGMALSADNLSGVLRRNPNSIRNALARLLAAGKIQCTHTANRSRHFRPHEK